MCNWTCAPGDTHHMQDLRLQGVLDGPEQEGRTCAAGDVEDLPDFKINWVSEGVHVPDRVPERLVLRRTAAAKASASVLPL